MPTLKEWIEECADGQPIEAVVIGNRGYLNGLDHLPTPRRKILTWDEALPFISYEFETGYGEGDCCHSIYAWTRDWVIFIHEYDGKLDPVRVPRNPIDTLPSMSGEF